MRIKDMTKKQMKGALIITLLLVSAFTFIPTLFLQQSFANTTIYTVNNEIWINATGISPSGDGEPTFLELKLDVSQSADNDGKVHAADNEGDRAFSPSEKEEWLLFKDLRRAYTSNPSDIITLAADCERYIGFQYVNNSVNLSSIPGSYFESLLPAAEYGAAVREVTLLFDAPAAYAEAYCAANGYTYLNVINASYEQIINWNALNSYRSRLLQTAMYTIENSNLTSSSLETKGDMHQQGILIAMGIALAVGAIIWGIAYLIDVLTPDPPSPPPPLTPPPANEIENMTIWAIKTFGHSVDQALAAYLNGTIDKATYMAIVDQLGGFIFGGLNNSVTVLEDLWRDYYNTTESMYNTYADMYDNYLQAFSASWTDWLTLMLIIIVVIIVLMIIYKVVSRKTADSATNAPQFIITK